MDGLSSVALCIQTSFFATLFLMRKFWLSLLFVMIFPRKVCAVELSIYDPIISNLEITVTASLSSSTNYYLQGTLRSQSSSKYFGETQNNKGDWIDYVSSPEKEYITSNFSLTDVKSASWSGQLKLRYKIDDPNYIGPGLYDLKLRRFTGGSTSSVGESNTIVVNLTSIIPTPTPSPSPSPSPSITPTPSLSPTPIPSPSPSSTIKPSPSPSPDFELSQEGTVAGIATEINLSGYGETPSPSPKIIETSNTELSLNQSRLKTVVMAGIGLIIISLAGYFGYRKNLIMKRASSNLLV